MIVIVAEFILAMNKNDSVFFLKCLRGLQVFFLIKLLALGCSSILMYFGYSSEEKPMPFLNNQKKDRQTEFLSTERQS